MELNRFIGIGLKWWWLIVLTTATVTVLSYFYTQRQPTRFQASTTILVGQTIQAIDVNAGDFNTTTQLAQTYADMAVRQPVLQEVVAALDLKESWRALKERVTASAVKNTQLLQITATGSNPEETRIIADEVARQLILLSPTALQNQEQTESQRLIRQRLDDIQAKIEAGQQQLKALDTELETALSAERVKELQNEINVLEGLIATWESNSTQLLIFVESKNSPNYLTVFETAQVSPQPARTLSTTLAGAAVGTALALSLILLIEYLDDTVGSADDLSRRLHLTVLGSVDRNKGKHLQDKLIANGNRSSRTAETYRMIRTNIQFICVGQSVKSMVVASPTSGEGKSITVANLGVVLAQAGFKTILVDTDLRQPALHELFQLSNTPGLTEFLLSPEPKIKTYLRQTNVDNLKIVTSGELPANPSELLGSRRMEQLLEVLNNLADFVIYDSPPVLAVTDAAVLANRVDGVIFVVKAGKTKLGAAGQALATLKQVEANILGGILNQVTRKGLAYPYPYYPGTAQPKEPAGAGEPAKKQQR